MTGESLLAASLSARFDAMAARPASMYERLPGVFHEPPAMPDAEGAADLVQLARARSREEMAGVGTSGAQVRLLQRMLAVQRHDPGPADGQLGGRTESAIRAFQRHRGLSVDGLVGPQTLDELTAPFVRRFLGGLQDVLDPVSATLDNLGGYVEIDTAPEPVLRWWAWLLGAAPAQDWPQSQRRELLRSALQRHRRRGTVLGIRQTVATYLDLAIDQVSVSDGGETAWDNEPDAPMRAASVTVVKVSVVGASTSDSEHERLRSALLATLPVGYSLELIETAPPE